MSSTASPVAAAVAGPRSYWRLSRTPRYSLLFALPLLLLYEALAAALSGPSGSGIRNGADVIIKSLFVTLAGAHGPLVFAAAVVGVSIWLIARDMRRSGGGLRGRVFAGMLAESAVMAILFGLAVGLVTARLLDQLGAIAVAGPAAAGLGTLAIGAQPQLDVPTQLMVSLGAGLYEELLFRVVLVTGLVVIARRALGMGPVAAGVAATLVGAVIFSAFHYVGPLGDPLRLDSFLFRTVAGVAFSGLYVTRGFGITAWTHALYDVFLLFGVLG
jgi:hypothetical protein